MEMLHAVFHRRLVGADLIDALLHQRPASGVHAQRDLVVFPGRFPVGGLFGVDEIAFEQHDLFRIIKLDDVGGDLRPARNQVRDDQHVGIPLNHDVGIEGEPDRAVFGHTFLESLGTVLEHFFMPLAVDLAAGARQRIVDSHGLDRITGAVPPGEVLAGHETAEARVEGVDVVVLEINLDEGLPVVGAFVDFDAIEHVTIEIKVGYDAKAAHVARHIAQAGKQ